MKGMRPEKQVCVCFNFCLFRPTKNEQKQQKQTKRRWNNKTRNECEVARLNGFNLYLQCTLYAVHVCQQQHREEDKIKKKKKMASFPTAAHFISFRC